MATGFHGHVDGNMIKNTVHLNQKDHDGIMVKERGGWQVMIGYELHNYAICTQPLPNVISTVFIHLIWFHILIC